MLVAEDLTLVSPEVIRLSANHEHTKPHVEWWVDYAPEPEADGGRAVFGTLHAFGPAGGGEVTVASVVIYPDSEGATLSEFEDALRSSDALETLYDFARVVLRSVVAIIDADPVIERAAPPATFGLLKRAEEPTALDDPSATTAEAP